jgi:hypothetical protein
MEILWILIILGIVIAFNSDKIDKAARSNNKIKKLLIALSTVLILANMYILLSIFI